MIMFQDEGKPKAPKGKQPLQRTTIHSFKEEMAKKSMEQVKKMAAESQSKVTNTIGKVSDVASKAGSVANIGQGIAGQIKSPISKPVDYGDMFSTNQSTSKIYNAKGIPENAVQGINRVVKLLIAINGEIIKSFKHFKLTQSAVNHHSFSLIIPHDALGEAEDYQLESAQRFLGKRLTVVFRYKDVYDSPERTFVGVITEVGFKQDQGSLGDIVIEGFSPTMLLDAAPNTQSFGGQEAISLNSIVNYIIQQGISKSFYDYRIAAKYGNIGYSAQYEETHYNYLARMAEAYGEQFFYDGEVLHFGELPPQEKPITLIYGSNVSDIKVKMKAQHVKPSFYGYNSSKNEKLTTGTSEIDHKSDIAKRAYNISQQAFTTPALRLAPIKAVTDMDISDSQKGATGSKAVDVFVTSGNTSVPFLYPSCIADIEMRKSGKTTTNYFTKLMITEVTHEVDARGYYSGTFEAIAADTGYIPRPEFKMPRAEAQVAKVISNKDPLNQGRVQVQFEWQAGQDYTDFIRVMTPDAGGSDKISKNRGFMSIPEVNDQVMIGFQHQLPDRPFVLGSMFHGKVGGGGGQGNNVRSFSSKSGNCITLNDGNGVKISDRSSNSVELNGAGNLDTNISANYTENVGGNQTTNITKNHELNVDLSSNTNVTNDLSIDVGEGASVLNMDSGGNISIKSGTNITLKVGASSIEITSDKISIKSVEIDIDGSGAKANFKSNTTITGTQVDIN